ncbi:MAG: phosphatidate cytidylyltransferase [Thalassospira sp.]|uniref:Phosphatidate cytidylyltransferase n=1 Tax=Thalassospira tepidiphila MCCC 1A03514 TaxID=1177930 RepID=A0A853KY80_9PROT|nr:phosphatidate cytidylyltransferase [Thalassospira sp.]MBO6803880.1 phosphatidate cytidylyltransferase [Thalassospira sp.]MBO6819472.1 phosphatidate cytidylyltransferase [Thalassospira sp.]MBO6889826.1 phosphatidate cytidylyltransferase [Thalassospira sp.]OAZ09534.1 phosphatidate cytidylyltransferase [Thalassospira tepidiphila MCCC 1A03514]
MVLSSETQDQKDTNSGLIPRVLSAMVMAPVAVAAVWFGSPYFDILLFVFSAGMMWEWSRMCAPNHHNGISVVTAVALAVAMIMYVAGQEEYIVMPIAIGVIIAAARSGPNWLLAGFGVLYISVAALSALWLRTQDGDGLLIIMWLFFLVWATDTGGYAFGKTIGGPKLAPRFSPKKTWAGLIGGMVCAGLIGGLVTYFSSDAINWAIVAVSMVLAIIAQIGDLGESALKRRFKVKDSSHLIPGHGGLLDRADGMLSVFPVAFAIICFAGLSLR